MPSPLSLPSAFHGSLDRAERQRIIAVFSFLLPVVVPTAGAEVRAR
ncbi:MAG: hypothetical protein IPG11_01390 [Flavobacteriales bacterium]|nr:hypothetical protein [Flavobacteriales bacterium]